MIVGMVMTAMLLSGHADFFVQVFMDAMIYLKAHGKEYVIIARFIEDGTLERSSRTISRRVHCCGEDCSVRQ